MIRSKGGGQQSVPDILTINVGFVVDFKAFSLVVVGRALQELCVYKAKFYRVLICLMIMKNSQEYWLCLCDGETI